MYGPTRIFWANLTPFPLQFQDKGYEWIWESSASLSPNRSRIFAHSMMHNYGDMMGLHNKSHPYVGFDWSDNHLGHAAGLLTQGVLGVPQDPFAPPFGPLLTLSRSSITH